MDGRHEPASSPTAAPATSDGAPPAPAQIVGRSAFGRLRSLRGRRRAARGPSAVSHRTAARSRAAVAGGWLVLLAVLAALGGFAFLQLGGTARAASSAPNQTTGNDVAAGAALFQQSCATCHGPQGQGVTDSNGRQRGPNIQNKGAAAADFVLSTGRMPLADPNQPMTRSKPAFNETQIRQLVAYVASLGKGPAIPQVSITGADLSRGRALFTANCAACHAPTGAGDAVGGGFNAPGLTQATPQQVVEAMRIGPPPMPVFGPNAFTSQDANDIAAYVNYLQNAPSPGGLGIGEIGPVPEGFVAFVVGLTAVMLIVRFVGRRGRNQEQQTTIPGSESER